jgi:hypothetical protein
MLEFVESDNTASTMMGVHAASPAVHCTDNACYASEQHSDSLHFDIFMGFGLLAPPSCCFCARSLATTRQARDHTNVASCMAPACKDPPLNCYANLLFQYLWIVHALVLEHSALVCDDITLGVRPAAYCVSGQHFPSTP